MRSLYQNTLNEMVQCDGVGLHSGKKVRMLLKPAKENTGIVFRRKIFLISLLLRPAMTLLLTQDMERQ